MKKLALPAIILGAAVLALSACSSTSSSPAVPAAPSSSAPAPASSVPAPVGADPSTWAPRELSQAVAGTEVSLVVGQRATFTDLPAEDKLNDFQVESSDPAVVLASQPGEGLVGGVEALAPGTSTVTVRNVSPDDATGGASDVVLQFTVNVKDASTEAVAAAAAEAAAASVGAQQTGQGSVESVPQQGIPIPAASN